MGTPAGLKQLGLGGKGFRHDHVAALGQQLRRECQGQRAFLLGAQPRDAGLHGHELAGDLPELRIRLGRVEERYRLAGPDRFALAHKQFAQDAALEVLDRLALAVDHDGALRQRRAVQAPEQRPAEERRDEGDDHDHAGDRGGAQLRLDVEFRVERHRMRAVQGKLGSGHDRAVLSTGRRAIFGSCIRAGAFCEVMAFMMS